MARSKMPYFSLKSEYAVYIDIDLRRQPCKVTP